jgi:hypothetical protein
MVFVRRILSCLPSQTPKNALSTVQHEIFEEKERERERKKSFFLCVFSRLKTTIV